MAIELKKEMQKMRRFPEKALHLLRRDIHHGHDQWDGPIEHTPRRERWEPRRRAQEFSL